MLKIIDPDHDGGRSDSELFLDVRHGNAEAKNDAAVALIERHRRTVEFAVRWLAPYLAEEATVDTYSQLATDCQDFDVTRPLSPYVFQLARNVARRIERDRRHGLSGRVPRSADIADPRPAQAKALLKRERMCAHVRDVIESIDDQSPLHRIKVLYEADCQLEQTATALGLTRRTIQLWLQHNREYLQLVFSRCLAEG